MRSERLQVGPRVLDQYGSWQLSHTKAFRYQLGRGEKGRSARNGLTEVVVVVLVVVVVGIGVTALVVGGALGSGDPYPPKKCQRWLRPTPTGPVAVHPHIRFQ